MNVRDYISEINKQYATGVAREHTYRPALQRLLAEMLPKLIVSNEPARQECGAPDYILQRKGNIPVAFIEAKDIDDPDLAGRRKNKEQFERYKQSLDNLIFTDYLDFHLYEKGEFVDSIRIAEVKGNKIVAIEANWPKFEHLIKHFGEATPQKITSSTKLAELMAGKARLMAEIIERSIEQGGDKGTLLGQMEAFKDVLMNDITTKEFADVYAQTIAYGMFAARLHDKTPDSFSRQEAATLIPRTNPFLRRLFQNIAGYDLDERISWIVDDLAESFRVSDMEAVMKGFGKRTQQNDPFIHFYEDFLSAYDPKLRKSRGVWYTPQPVVNFIVRAVDEILQTEFQLPMGLADTSTIKAERSVDQSSDKRYSDGKKKELREYHKVQILDPATGTGTFLAEVISQIYQKFQGQAGMWQGYVEEHLIPRLNGFELLMASYTMAHLKLDMLLEETGYKSVDDQRLRVYLTNSLEEHHKDTGTLFAQFLAREANEANAIKRDTPVMVIMGNPPYSGESKNKGEWIMNLMEDYKREPNTTTRLQERNSKWLNDDYCKFIRLGQEFVDKNTEGVLAYINNHGFLDNPTFRGMRWNLMKSFDKIYIIDLHGNSLKKEVCPDGSKDENVFDIQVGVSINIFVKTGKKHSNALAEVYHYDLWGRRKHKYKYLTEHTLTTVPFEKIEPQKSEYFFTPKDYESMEKYNKGFSVVELMPVNGVGICSKRDAIAFHDDKEELISVLNDFDTLPEEEIKVKYNITRESRDQKVSFAKSNIGDYKIKDKYIKRVSYRPFDMKWTYFTDRVRGFLAYPVYKIMNHLAVGANVGLVIGRQGQAVGSMKWNLIFISDSITDLNLYYRGGGVTFPLYLYPEQADLLNDGERTPNLNQDIVNDISKAIGLEFEPEKSGDSTHFAPIDLLDYIYAVLHSPTYRDKYAEFLKIDFPRVPYPENGEQFRQLAEIGSELRKVHLMEHSDLAKLITTYPIAGDNVVGAIPDRRRWELSEDGKKGKVWVNETQYFDNVPLVAWEFYIGGYQPAQKWLKDRRDRTLNFEDIMHYQRIIKALVMTDSLMRSITFE